MILRIVLFYLLAFFFTFLMGGIQQAARLNTELSALPQWGPGLAGMLMLLIFRRDELRLNFKALYVLFAVMAFIGFSITLYYLVREIDFNIWVASLFHFGINLSSLFYISIVNQASFMLINAVARLVMAIIVVMGQKRFGLKGIGRTRQDRSIP